MKEFHRLGFIGRFKPLHKGAALALETLCEKAEHVIIGIGSANKYNMRNPFTAEESGDMIDLFLSQRFDNYEIMYIPDSGHIPEYNDGQQWRRTVRQAFGELDYFASGNDYVKSLLGNDYNLIHPASLIPKEKQMFVKATQVRVAMARNENWQQYVPGTVANYLQQNNLVERFQKEFGLETLASALNQQYWRPEDLDQERLHTFER